MIIDATDLILGRLSAFVAKKALMGETISIINAEKAVITGQPKRILADYKQTRNRGAPLIGPYFPRTPERIVKRTIRGMIPYKKARGREALARVKCYSGVPEEFSGKEITKMPENMHVEKTHAKYVTIKRISQELGAKVE